MKSITVSKKILAGIIDKDSRSITRKTFQKIWDELTENNPDWLFDKVYDIDEGEVVIEHAFVDVLVNGIQKARLYWSHYTMSKGKKCDRNEYKFHKL